MARRIKQKDVDSQIGEVQFNSQEAFFKWLEASNVPVETIITPSEYKKRIGVPAEVSQEQLEELVSRFHKAFYEHRLDSKAFKEYLDYAYRLFPVEYSGHNKPIGYLFGEVAGVDMEKLGQIQTLLTRYRGKWTAKTLIDQVDELASQAFTEKQYQEFKNLDSPVLKRNYIENVCDEYKLNTYSDINKFLSSRTSWEKIKNKITKTFNKNKTKAPSSFDELLADENTKKLETTKLIKYLIQADRINKYLVEHKRDLEAFDEIKSVYYEHRPYISERKLKDRKQDKDASWLNPEELGELDNLGFETDIFREQFYSGARVRKNDGVLSSSEVDQPLSGYTLGSAKRAVMAVDGLTSTIMEKYALDRLGLLQKDEKVLNFDNIKNSVLKLKIEKVLCRNGENVQDMVKLATDRAVQINEIIDSTFDVFNQLYPKDSLLNDKNLKTNVGVHKDKLDDFKRQVLRTSIYYGALAKKDDEAFHHAMVQTFTDPALTSKYFNSEFLYALDREKLYQTNYPESIIKYKDFDGKEKEAKAGELDRANSYAVISYEDKTYFVKDIPVITSFDKEGKVSEARLCMSDEEFDGLIRDLSEEYNISFGDLSRKHITVGSNAFAQAIHEKLNLMEKLDKAKAADAQVRKDFNIPDASSDQDQQQEQEVEAPEQEAEQVPEEQAEQTKQDSLEIKHPGAFKYFINNEAYLKALEKKAIGSGYRPVHGVSALDELVEEKVEDEVIPEDEASEASVEPEEEVTDGPQKMFPYGKETSFDEETVVDAMEPAADTAEEDKKLDEDEQPELDFGEEQEENPIDYPAPSTSKRVGNYRQIKRSGAGQQPISKRNSANIQRARKLKQNQAKASIEEVKDSVEPAVDIDPKEKKRSIGKIVLAVRESRIQNNPNVQKNLEEEKLEEQRIADSMNRNQAMLNRTRARLAETQAKAPVEQEQNAIQKTLLNKFIERDNLTQELKEAKIAKTNASRHVTSVKNTKSEIENWVVSLKSNSKAKQSKLLTEKEEELQKADSALSDAVSDFNNKSRTVNELSAKLLLLNTEIKKLQEGKSIPQTAKNQEIIEEEKPDWQKEAEAFNKRTNAAERLAALKKQKEEEKQAKHQSDDLSLEGVIVPELQESEVDVDTDDLDLSNNYNKEYEEAEATLLPLSNGASNISTADKTYAGKDSIVVTGKKNKIDKLKKQLEEDKDLEVHDDSLSLD